MTKDEENLRTEYSAISQYHNSLVTFRLTLLGFYLAAVGFLVGGGWPIKLPICFLGLLLTFCMYIFELRTRVLFEYVARRGIEIEQDDWNFKSKTPTKQPFFSRQYPEQETTNYGIKLRIFGKKSIEEIPILKIIRISHSFALDILYWGIAIFFLVSFFISIFASPQSAQTPSPSPTATATSFVSVTSTTSPATFTPTFTATPMISETPTILVTATHTP